MISANLQVVTIIRSIMILMLVIMIATTVMGSLKLLYGVYVKADKNSLENGRG